MLWGLFRFFFNFFPVDSSFTRLLLDFSLSSPIFHVPSCIVRLSVGLPACRADGFQPLTHSLTFIICAALFCSFFFISTVLLLLLLLPLLLVLWPLWMSVWSLAIYLCCYFWLVCSLIVQSLCTISNRTHNSARNGHIAVAVWAVFWCDECVPQRLWMCQCRCHC